MHARITMSALHMVACGLLLRTRMLVMGDCTISCILCPQR